MRLFKLFIGSMAVGVLATAISLTGLPVNIALADDFKPLAMTCSSLKNSPIDPFGIWKDDEIADAQGEGWAETAKVCIGKQEIGGSTYMASMLIGAACSSSVCPVRVIKTDELKKRRQLLTDMMCASQNFYAFAKDGSAIKACDQVFKLGGRK